MSVARRFSDLGFGVSSLSEYGHNAYSRNNWVGHGLDTVIGLAHI